MMTAAVPHNIAGEDPVDALIKSIRIPPRPSLLTDLQQELARSEPDPRSIAKIIGSDVGMSGALLKLANSSFFGLSRKVTSVDQGIAFLGINQCAALATGVLARQAIGMEGGPALEKFWDMSTKRAKALVFLAGRTRACKADIAHTFGLFCDIGVPLLMNRFPEYVRTYAEASSDPVNPFTVVEDDRHSTNHAAIGCLLARNWGLSVDVSSAILLHHDYTALEGSGTDDAVRSLVSLFVLAENILQKHSGQGLSAEWEKGGELACRHLGLDAGETADLLEELHEALDNEL
ncbi:MAG TPA: HDOD domain-containing protein [Paucimonas sp.]|nr:HDOD domain-containing protein [Paucimonas sp.]